LEKMYSCDDQWCWGGVNEKYETQDIKPGDVLEKVDEKTISSATQPVKINELI
jgi:hypothetical protein